MRFRLHTRRRKISIPYFCRAFTAFETLIAVTILAIITAAVSGALSAGRQQTRTANDLLLARMHAEALLAEVLRLPPDTVTGKTYPPSGFSRTSATYLQDYHNYSDGPYGISDLHGNTYPESMQGFERKITVTRNGLVDFKTIKNMPSCTVTITITRNGSTLINQSRLVPG